MKKFIIAIDQGTTSTRAILFNLSGKPIFLSQKEFKQYFPKDGWVEHNPNEIWNTTKKVLIDVIKKSKKLKGKILTIGITNQRETTILWDKKTGKHVYNAIVWQDRRTAEFCNKFKTKKREKIINKKTGLLIDPYFSNTKIKWILDNIKSTKKLIKNNQLLFGTVDTFLIWKLTKGKIHATDATNACRTMMFNITTNKWDKDILRIFKIPKNILPEVKDSSDDYGFTAESITGKSYPINGVIGDQQAAIIGQSCFTRGSVKSTYGTGAFIIMNTGNKKIYSKNKLLTTICYRLNGKITYALEGSIFIAGAGIQWLRDKIKIINTATETEKIVKSLKSNNGVYLVPAFTGLGAPYWNPIARGIISGLTRDTSQKEIVRATIESVAYQSYDLFNAMRNDGIEPNLIKVDGGMVKNNWFSQFLSNVIDLKVIRPKVQETSALGAAYMAGLKIGVYKSLSDISKNWKIDKKFNPKINKSARIKLLKGWQQAIRKTLI
ncbi:glycerol kinase GlpK [bacterium]|nr:glycerol kinase GlpK [bacterium]|tara:strand:+ start:2964 stop:4442 length:1479 start_codon:yes stop_codon:yes gene_type:complete